MTTLKLIAGGLFWGLLLAHPFQAQQFFPDDPLWKDPPPRNIPDANYRALNEFWDFGTNRYGSPGELQPHHGVISAQGINTLGEVPDGPWYQNRHASRRMSPEQLRRGPGNERPPALDKPWETITVKQYGFRPGLLIQDSRKQLYLLRFDPRSYPEVSTGATLVAANLMFALGYWVPENYIIYFQRGQLAVSAEGEVITTSGKPRKLKTDDIDLYLRDVYQDKARGYRAVAVRMPAGKPLGPFEFFGTRSDDLNDIVFHEHRRDLRGLSVFASWLNNQSLSPLETFDLLRKEEGVQSIRHYLASFYGCLGSAYNRGKEAYMGQDTVLDGSSMLKNFLGMGIYTPAWQRAASPKLKGVGLFEAEVFDPDTWTPNYLTAPQKNRLPDDLYWAAKKVMAFSDEDLRILVSTGQYSDPAAAEWLARCLSQRRDKIGRAFIGRVLPLDNFRVEAGEVKYDDLEVQYGFTPVRTLTASWATYDNFQKREIPIYNSNSFKIPSQVAEALSGSYFAVRISGKEEGKTLTLFLRKEETTLKPVGIERGWSGKILAESRQTKYRGKSRYAELDSRQKSLFDQFTQSYRAKTGTQLQPEEYFHSMAIAERTTFDAVTNAMLKSQLTSPNQNSLGIVFDLVEQLDRIAGQYFGRQGDEQFRLYFTMRPGARDTLEKSLEFRREQDNAVYHQDYPVNFRQDGKPPTMQISMSEDGLKADIDVDYRSSKLPAAMWNGHLSSANSDVRAGDNYKPHNMRWSGLVSWWQELFGNLGQEAKKEDDLLSVEAAPEGVTLPPDRPLGAEISQVQDAALEFLADWLVRHKVDEAMSFISDQALECFRINQAEQRNVIAPAHARTALENIMKAATQHLGKHQTLSPSIEAVIPWRKQLKVMDHPYAKDFTIVEVPDSFAGSFLCQSPTRRSQEALSKTLDKTETQYGSYYGTLFRIRTSQNQGAVLALLWARENAAWRILSYDVLRP